MGSSIRFVRVGTLDELDRLPPDIHIFTASKQAWLVLQLARQPSRRITTASCTGRPKVWRGAWPCWHESARQGLKTTLIKAAA